MIEDDVKLYIYWQFYKFVETSKKYFAPEAQQNVAFAHLLYIFMNNGVVNY